MKTLQLSQATILPLCFQLSTEKSQAVASALKAFLLFQTSVTYLLRVSVCQVLLVPLRICHSENR